MTQTILIILGIAIIVILFSRTRFRTRLRTGKEQIVGICVAAMGIDAKKRENKEKISALLSERGELSNSDIREALKVSGRSVMRYMDELEKEGKVEQVGNTGRNVVYRLKP